MDNDRQRNYGKVLGSHMNDNSESNALGTSTDSRSPTAYAPERPGSAPPTFTLNSTNLFAFGASSSSNVFSGLRLGDNFDPNNSGNPSNSNNSNLLMHHTGDGHFMHHGKAIPSRRKNSIEMFLSQSPSQALGEEFMKMNFDEQNLPPPCQTRNFHPHTVEITSRSASSNNQWDSSFYLSASRSTGSLLSNHNGQHRKPHNIRDSLEHAEPTDNQPQSSHYTSRSKHQDSLFPSKSRATEPPGLGMYYVPPYEVSNSSSISPRIINSASMGSNGVMSHHLNGVVSNGSIRHNLLVPGMVPVQWATVPVMTNVQPPLPLTTMGSPVNVYSSPSQSNTCVSGSPVDDVGIGENATGKLCKFYAQGHCRMGVKCKFSHGSSGSKSPYGSDFGRHQGSGESPEEHRAPIEVSPHCDKPQKSDKFRKSFFRRDPETSNDPNLPDLSIEDIKGRVFSMSKDQNGCRLLQEHLEFDRPFLCNLIFDESLEQLAEMMVDPFGNYLFQKLLERVTESQKTAIIKRVGSNLVAAALNLHGTRSVQKVVEVCSTPEQVRLIVAALRKQAVRLCIDSNGNHVIQRALQHMSPNDNQFVFDAVCDACVVVGTHRHGCCVLQRCLDAANSAQKKVLILQVEKEAMNLMQDPYGNYVVQYVLDTCTREEAAGVIMKPLGNVAHLSVQKFSSNVIEKCLEKASEYVCESYLDEIMNPNSIRHLLQDQYANYVVQRALSVCTAEQGMALVDAIRPHLPAMRNTSGGRRITARILKRFPHINLESQDSYPLLYSPTSPVASSTSSGDAGRP